MKRIGNLYSKICDIENLRQAHKNAKRGKGWYQEVKMIDENPDYYLYKIQEMLINHTYVTSNYEIFYKQEGDKIRKIYKLPYYPDRIVQWAIVQVIEPYIIRHLITDTYSAIPERGIHKGLLRLRHALYADEQNCTYCLKIDARHYYQSINHDILKQKYRRIFKDPEVLSILDEIIDSVNTADDSDLYEIYVILLEEEIDPNTGEPIGNYLSQYSGNYYFSDFDHWMKEVKYVKYYFRYMDDIIILGKSKEELRELLEDIRIYFKDNMKIRLKNNWQIFPSYVRGIDFLGYRNFKDYSLLRKSTCNRMKEKLISIQEKVSNGNMINYSEWCSINSYKGWLTHCNSYRLSEKYVKPLESCADKYYNCHVKKAS